MQFTSVQFFCFWLLGGGLSSLPFAGAYRVGDAVDTDVSMDGFLWDALRSQMPKFGVNTKVYFDMDMPEDDRQYRTSALLFEDGLRSLETRPYQNWKRDTLERITVKFVYSKSAAVGGGFTGVIHSVSSTAEYQTNRMPSQLRRFRVEYEWYEEEAVRLAMGFVVMYLAVFVASIIFLFQTCGLTSDPPDTEHKYAAAAGGVDYMGSTSSYSNHKKW